MKKFLSVLILSASWASAGISIPGAGGTGSTLPPVAGQAGKFLNTDGSITQWLSVPGGGDMLRANNLSDLTNFATARVNLSLVPGTNVQAYDADLLLYGAITPSANVQTFLGAANYGAMRTQLGLVVGTDVQAYDADLTSLAAATGTNTIYARTGADTWTAVNIGANLSFSGGTLSATGGGGSGTVTSVAATTSSSGLGISGSPVATSGTFVFTLTPSAFVGITGPQVAFADTDNKFAATNVQAAIEELDNTNGSGVNAADGKVAWTQLTGVPTGFADGSDDGSGGGSGTVTNTGGALTLNAVMLGAGGVDSKVLGSLGTTTTVLHGNAAGAPTFGAVSLTADVSGDLPLANLAQGSALSLLGVAGNATSDNASIVAASDGQVMRRSGTAIAFGSVDVANANSITGILPDANIAATITRDSEASAAYQPISVNLTAYAGIAPSANVQSLLGAANYAAMRTQLGLVIGTNVLAPDGNGSALTGFTDAQIPATIARDAEVAAAVAINPTGFNGNLNPLTDDTIQEVAQKVDDLVIGSGGGDATLSGTQTFTGAKTFDLPITVNKNFISPDQAMGASAIDTSELNNTVSSAVPTTLTFSAEPAAGATFGVWITNTDAVENIWTIPSTISEGLGVARTALLIQPGEPYYVRFRHKGSGVYWMDGDPIDYTDYPSDIPASDDLLVFQQDSSGLYRTTTVADLIGSSGVGDSLLVNGTAITDIAGVDLIDSADIILTLSAGASPDTLSFALPATVDLDAKTAVLVPTVATATNTTAAASSAMVQARITAWVTESASLQNKSLTHSSNTLPNRIQIACSDMTTAITTGQNKAYFRAPHAMTVGGVRASSFTAPTGAAIIIDIEEEGFSILGGTRLQVDATENTSQTALNPATISDATIADDALVTIDFDQVGSTLGGAGIIVTIYYEY